MRGRIPEAIPALLPFFLLMLKHLYPTVGAAALLFSTTLAGQGTDSQGTASSAPSWSNWRGPDFTAASPTGDPPVEWDEESGKNIRWKVELPGRGSSSPVTWNDLLFVTTAIPTDKDGKPPVTTPPADDGRGAPPGRERGGRRGGRRGRRGGRRGGGMRAAAPSKIHDFAVMAFDRKTGKEAWRTVVSSVVPHAGTHRTGTQASNSPVTDGEHIFAFFGSRGLHCLDMKGEKKWSKEFGLMRTRNSFGEGASPALHGNTIVVNWDHEDASFIVALDKNKGKELWRNPRDEKTSWATPVVVEVDGKPQVIVPATNQSIGYDLKTGKELWSCAGLTTNVIPTPIIDNGVAYLMSGYRGNALQAIKLSGAKGDITEKKNLLWKHSSNCSYTPSAVLTKGHLFFLRSNNATLSCVRAADGEVAFEGERLRGLRTVYSSPVAAADRVYITGREGNTRVIQAGPEFKILASNKLMDTVDATPAIVGDSLYVRGWSKLYCIATTKPTKKGD